VEGSLVRYVDVLNVQTALDPLGQFLVFSRTGKSSVSQNHQPVVILATHDTAQTLSALSHGIELEELVSVHYLFFLDHETDPLEQHRVV
jgi:uncharacterized NAD(P)/FAD-binding protein YdhS